MQPLFQSAGSSLSWEYIKHSEAYRSNRSNFERRKDNHCPARQESELLENVFKIIIIYFHGRNLIFLLNRQQI